jgi:hypothetical protein
MMVPVTDLNKTEFSSYKLSGFTEMCIRNLVLGIVVQCSLASGCWRSGEGGGGVLPPSGSTGDGGGVFPRGVGARLRGCRVSRQGEAQSNQFNFCGFRGSTRLMLYVHIYCMLCHKSWTIGDFIYFAEYGNM